MSKTVESVVFPKEGLLSSIISRLQKTSKRRAELSSTHKSLLRFRNLICMRVIPEHVELLQLSVWELSKAIPRAKPGWILSLPGASLGMCDWRSGFESFVSSCRRSGRKNSDGLSGLPKCEIRLPFFLMSV